MPLSQAAYGSFIHTKHFNREQHGGLGWDSGAGNVSCTAETLVCIPAIVKVQRKTEEAFVRVAASLALATGEHGVTVRISIGTPGK